MAVAAQDSKRCGRQALREIRGGPEDVNGTKTRRSPAKFQANLCRRRRLLEPELDLFMTASNGIRLSKFAWALALTVAVSAITAPAVAQDPPAAASEDAAVLPDPNRVYATVDGVSITEADLAAASQDYAETLAKMPPEIRLSQLLNVVIDMRLLANAAEKAGNRREG